MPRSRCSRHQQRQWQGHFARLLAQALLCSGAEDAEHKPCGACRGCKRFLSRTHPDLIKRLFEVEVPEIADGTVLIHSVAREAGNGL